MPSVTLSPPTPTAVRPRGSGTPAIPTHALADIVGGLARARSLWDGFVPELGRERSSVHLLATDAYDVWLIGWPPGTRVEPHDHGSSAGAFTVVRGTLSEYRWASDPTPRPVHTGDIVTIEAGVVHDVVSDVVADSHDRGPAVSIHAYSPPLREMGFYADDGVRLLTRVAVEMEPAVLAGA